MKIKYNFKTIWVISFLSICIQTILHSQSVDVWNEIRVPNYLSKYKYIDFQDSLHGWLCTQDGKIIITNNGGISWTKDSISNIIGTVAYIKITSIGRGWIFTDDKMDFRLWTGYYKDSNNITNKFSWPDTNLVSALNGVSVINDSTFIFLSQTPGNLGKKSAYHVSGYGSLREKINLDFTPAYGLFNSIAFVDDKKGWITLGGNITGSSVVSTIDGGLTWSWDDLNNYDIISRQIRFFNSKNGYINSVLFYPDFYYNQCSFTVDGGITYVKIVNAHLLTGIYYSQSDYVFISLYSKFARKSSDTTYVIKELPFNDTSYYASPYFLESTDSKNIWVLTVEGKLFKRINILTSVNTSEKLNLPRTFSISNNYPNPFNPSTTINYQLPNDSYVTLKVYDMVGREVATLVDEAKTVGNYSVIFSAEGGFASGVYLYRFTAGKFSVVKKLMLLK